jgi:hypothetical protein
MSKTQIAPNDLSQLKKIFPESVNGKDIKLEFGKVRLSAGKAFVKLSGKYQKPHIFITPINTTAAYRYSIIIQWNDKFQIVSSDTGDTSEVFWMGIGG